MKSTKRSLVAIALALPLMASASWDSGDPFLHPGAKDSPIEVQELSVTDGFGAQFWIIPDDTITGRWFQMDVHKIRAVSSTRKNRPVVIALYFVNARQNEGFVRQGSEVVKMQLINVTFDLHVIRPDGVEEKYRDLHAWQGVAPPPYLLHIAKAKATITFDVEPAGPYRIQVVVHDHFRKTNINLERRLIVYE